MKENMRNYGVVALAVLALGLCPSAANASVVHLNIDFENGYVNGPVAGQSNGGSGGPWTVGPGTYDVQSTIALGNRALSSTRSGASDAMAPMLADLDTSSGNIYLAFSIFRADDDDQGAWTLINTNSGAATGLGIVLGTGANPVVNYITNGFYATAAAGLTLTNGVWYKFEFEANATTKKYDLFYQLESSPGRQTVASNVDWANFNTFVNALQVLPQGGAESTFYTDNILLTSGVTFPVPEPSATLLLASGLILLYRRR